MASEVVWSLSLGYFREAGEDCGTGLILGISKVEGYEDREELNFHI